MEPGAPRKILRPPSLAMACFTGLFLAAAVFSLMVFFSIYPGRNTQVGGQAGRADPFYRGLREYDALFARARPADNPGLFTRALDRLEKSAPGVESRLSLLKRRRALARQDSRFITAYQEKALEAAAAFPHSESLAAVAAESLLMETGIPGTEAAARLRELGERIRDNRPLALGIFVLSGDLADPARAAAVPGLAAALAAGFPPGFGEIPPGGTEGLLIDAAILNILQNDIPAAAARINALLSPANPAGPGGGEKTYRFAGEFFYDHGSPLRAAEMFSIFPDEFSMARTADAFLLAGLENGARNIWTVLAAPAGGGRPPSQAIRNRSLYNLAASAENLPEKQARLEELLAEGQRGLPWYDDPENAEAAYIYGLIRYTRLLDTPRAITILENGRLASHPLLDLELLRRSQTAMPLNQNIAETWMLLGRHEGNEDLYEWAAWYFQLHRQYNELSLLIKSADRQTAPGRPFSGPWLELHKCLILIRESRLEEAVEKLRALSASSTGWEAPANLARIMEARRSPAAALEYYETAASRTGNRETASILQYRISRCMKTLGLERESRRTLEYALELNPENFNARLELRRLDGRLGF